MKTPHSDAPECSGLHIIKDIRVIYVPASFAETPLN